MDHLTSAHRRGLSGRSFVGPICCGRTSYWTQQRKCWRCWRWISKSCNEEAEGSLLLPLLRYGLTELGLSENPHCIHWLIIFPNKTAVLGRGIPWYTPFCGISWYIPFLDKPNGCQPAKSICDIYLTSLSWLWRLRTSSRIILVSFWEFPQSPVYIYIIIHTYVSEIIMPDNDG